MRRMMLMLLLLGSLVLPAQASNVLTQNPIIVDTVAATALITGYFEVVAIRWHSCGTAGHDAIVQNAAGTVKWQANCSTSTLQDEQSSWPVDAPLRMQGLLVPTLGSGTLLIYVKGNVVPS